MTASTLVFALAATAALGAVGSAWVWLIRRPQAEREEGLKLLAAMRWREFSRLVIDGLRSRGFEPEALEDAAERGQDSVIHLRRDGQEWLLACKQGLNYRITPSVIGDITDAVRFHGAAGGVVATPGSAETAARRLASDRVEVYDGESLWPVLRPQLSHGVQEEIAQKSRHAARRHTVLAWIAAATLGLVLAFLAPTPTDDTTVSVAETETNQVTERAAATATPASPAARPVDANAAAPVAAAPTSEGEQRDDVIRMVATLPGVERAMWSTRSTLLIYLADETSDPVRGICDILQKFEPLRTSRLHLQPPAGASRPARFLQCTTY